MSKNSNLNKANKSKNDEFYTMLSDIEAELQHYENHFKDKTVYCNCDNPEQSNFWRYFEGNFEHLGLTALVSTYFVKEGVSYCTIKYDGGIKRIKLNGNGDFRSQECIDILKTIDIVVTNPPFSLFREYVGQLMEYKKKFLIIGSQNAITYKEFFPLLKDNQVWLGYNSVKQFIEPNGEVKKFGNICWYTNLPIIKRNEPIKLTKCYSPEEYPRYDNYDAINIDKVNDIPMDYSGVMGVPISFMNKYCPEQFEIVGLTSGRDEFEYPPAKRYVNPIQINADGTKTNGSKANTRATILLNREPLNETYYKADNSNGYLKIMYARILIKKTQG